MSGDDRVVRFGRYRVEGLIGRGGMGEVHRAVDTESGRVVALKRLTGTGDEASAARFRRESRIVASLAAPHIVTIHDHGEIDGRLYLAMRLVEGSDLRRLLDAGPIPPERALRILGQVASALDAAHAAGVVHRDVKPSNILLDEDDTAYLADFGIAKSLAPDATRVTGTDGEIGTLDYLAPERLTRSGADHRADVYALACVLFECLTGRKPFPAEDVAGKLAAQLNDPAPAPSLFDWRIPRAVDLVVATGMDKDPRRRYPSAGELMAAADTAFRHEPVTTPELSGSPGTGQFIEAIVAVASRHAPVPADEPPYPGLRSFVPAEAGLFHGRDHAITDVLVRLSRQSPVTGPLVIVGASGTGKSSLLRAGVLPALTSVGPEPWPQLVTTPGPNPIGTLAARLAPLARTDPAGLARWLSARPAEFGTLCARIGGRGRLVLVVDQFEEIFTAGADEQREAFATLLAHAWPALVVLSVRADFLDRCLRLRPLRTALSQPYPLAPLGAGDLARVILEPARIAGLEVEDGLVDRLITDVGATGGDGLDPGALPRLAHALRETWHNRAGAVLTLKGYQDTGGVDQAVARTADGIHARLPPHDQAALRTALLRLVTVLGPRQGGGVARRRAARAEIPDHLLHQLVDARLVTADTDGVELSHDALLTAWPRLREWVDEDRQGLLVRQHLDQAAAAWEAATHDQGELYRGARLATAQEWAEGRTDLTPAERGFLHASRREQRRGTRRLRVLVGGLAVFLVVALVAGGVAIVKWGDATAAADEAESRGQAAGSLADAEFDPLGARVKALKAWQLSDTRQARGALLASATYDAPAELRSRVFKAHAVALSPDGGLIAVGGGGGEVRVVDARTGERVGRELTDHVSAVEVAFSGDGTMLATTGTGGKDDLRVWEVPSGRLLATLPARGLAVWRADGALVSMGFPDGPDQPARAMGAWQPRTGDLLGWLTTPYDVDERAAIRSGAFSEDGGRLALGRTNGVVELWDPATATLVRRDTVHRDNRSAGDQGENATARVAFSPESLATASAADGMIRFADPVTGAARGEPIPVDPTFRDVVFTGDGRHVLTVHHGQGGIGRWTVDGGRLDAYLAASSGGGAGGGRVVATAVSESGDTVAVQAGGGLVLWRRNEHRTFAPTGPTHDLAISPDGALVATAAADGLYTWVPDTGATGRERPDGSPFAVAYLRDGTRLDAARDGTVRVTAPDGAVRTAPLGFTAVGDAEIAATADGRRFAVRARGLAADGTDHTTVTVVDTDSLAVVSVLDLGRDVVSGPVFTADDTLAVIATATPRVARPGETVTELRRWRLPDLTEVEPVRLDAPGVVTAAPDGRSIYVATHNQVQVRDAATGRLLHEFGAHPAAVGSIAVSPDGRWLATGLVGDPAIRLYDRATRRHLATLDGHDGGTTALAFSPDGRTLASTGADTTVIRWPVDPDDARREVCQDLATAGRRDLDDLGCP